MNYDPCCQKTEGSAVQTFTSTANRHTPSQVSVLHTLQQQQSPISAQSLYVIMKEEPIGLATIYRALEALQLLGLVQHRVSITGEKLYSIVEQERHYLTCLQCGESFPLETCPVKKFEAQLQESGAFKIYYHTLEFFGLCEPCALNGGTVHG